MASFDPKTSFTMEATILVCHATMEKSFACCDKQQ